MVATPSLSLLVLWLSASSETGDASLAAQPDPSEILDGTPVPACGWPTVVQLWDEDEEAICTGVWIGGRVVVTAHHCITNGFFVPTTRPCNSAADCPSVGEYDDVIDLECFGDWSCHDPDRALSNIIRYAKFGQSYAGWLDDGHIRRAVPIAYCRAWDDMVYAGVENPPSVFGDFAYCILTTDPGLQPVPVMMHCEADQYLTEGSDAVAVGFGDFGDDTSGIKRYATAELPGTYGSGANMLPMGSADWMPGPPQSGDSGGPLFVQLPDGTWRVAGIVINSIQTYNTIWNRIAWMAQDPHVDVDAILPCHDVDGNWDPGPNCGGFPLNPGASNGGWRLSPACADPSTSGASQTCVALAHTPEPELATPTVAPAVNDVGKGATGCRSGSPALGATVLVGLLLIGWRRRHDA